MELYFNMSEQCGLSIGSEVTSFNLHINGIVLKDLKQYVEHTFDTIIEHYPLH